MRQNSSRPNPAQPATGVATTRRRLFAMPLLALAAVLTGCGGEVQPDAPAREFNLVLLVVDSLRADHLGLYGYDAATSPFLDRLGAGSVVFDRAYAASSYTSQSTAALLTGRLPTSGGSIGLLEAEPSEEAMTLARVFRGGGFRTGIVSNQPLLRSRGFTRGFEDIQVSGLENAWNAEQVSERALRFVDDYSSERFLLYAHYLEPHQPYEPPPQYLDRFVSAGGGDGPTVGDLTAEIGDGSQLDAGDPRLRALVARYDAEIAAVDAAIGQLVEGLDERGLLADTVIVVTGSQGEEFGEHGYLGHAWTLHEEVLRVPLLLHAPELLPPQRLAAAVSGVDVFPSMLTLFGLDSGDWQADGSSFLQTAGADFAVRPPQAAKIAELVIRERCILRAVIQGDWKYVSELVSCPPEERGVIANSYTERVTAMSEGSLETPPLWGEAQREALYNLTDDPGETQNLAASTGEQLASLRALLENYQAYCEVNALAAQEAVAPETYDPEAAERLRSLGYL